MTNEIDIDLVFTSHPTMIYNLEGNIRDKPLSIIDEFNEIDFYIKNVNSYLKSNNINNIKISSWCGGDRDGNPNVDHKLTKHLLKDINYDLDVRENSRKLEEFYYQYVHKSSDVIENINNFTCINNIENNELINTLKIMKDEQRFIISDCEEYLHIYLIWKLCKLLNKNIKIIPLFESSKTLEKSTLILEKCLLNNLYVSKDIEIMLAYSDTSKMDGIIDSTFKLYFTQIKIHDLMKKYNKQAIFFHGRGGSFPRGGGSYKYFFNRLPNNSLKKIRVTVQGERIYHEFGDKNKIKNTINEIYKAYENRIQQIKYHNYSDNFIEKIKIISDKTRKEYQEFIEKNDISKFFIDNTHYLYLSELYCGSRPIKRNNNTNIKIEDIRTITWIFGWSSIDFYLPWWLGYNQEFNDFITDEKFIPWNNLVEQIHENIFKSKITAIIEGPLLQKYLKIINIITNKKQLVSKDDIINKIINRNYVG